MAEVPSGGRTAAPQSDARRIGALLDSARPRLSVCCMTSGRSPRRLAAILSSLEGLAGEVVVAVEEEHADAASSALRNVADRIVAFPRAEPADSAIPWLLSECRGRWVLNLDDDEVPSPALIEALPDVLRDLDLTHGWIARRWLYPDPSTYLAEAPWDNEFQLRLFRADARAVRATDRFHLPLVAEGPCRYLAEPLWHLDMAVSELAHRYRKARFYEQERPGMRIGPLSHNTGLYVPELGPEPRLAPVPAQDMVAIARALDESVPIRGSRLAVRSHARRSQIDAHWPQAPGDESYRATIEMLARPATMIAGRPHTVDVRVTNLGDITWPWGTGGTPEIRLAYRWSRDGSAIEEPRALRTPLPSDLRPDGALIVPVHVVAPRRAGEMTLTVDLVHEHHRWFDVPATAEVTVRQAPRVAVIGPGAEVTRCVVALAGSPDVEVVALCDAPRDVPRAASPCDELVTGLPHKALRARAALALRCGRLVVAACRARLGGRMPGALGEIAACDVLVVAGRHWTADAAAGRERIALATLAAASRIVGTPVHVVSQADGVAPGLRHRTRGTSPPGTARRRVADLLLAAETGG